MDDRSFTMLAEDGILDLVELDRAAVWEDITSTPADSASDLWRKKLEKIGRENALSGRHALMRLLCCRARGLAVFDGERTAADVSEAGFTAAVEDREYHFPEISPERAETMPPEESRAYLALLMQIARRQADFDQELSERILSRAWFDEESANKAAESRLVGTGKEQKKARAAYEKANRRLYKNRMTREEALLLGHILDFSLLEMQWFLLRTQYEGECFRFNHSEDLIEAYGFLTGSSHLQVRRLKERYARMAEDLEKEEDYIRDEGFTQDISDSLPARVEQWKQYPETMEEAFLEWMRHRAPGLDIPSRTAGRIYRNLAVYAYELCSGERDTPEETELPLCVYKCCASEESEGVIRHLYRQGALSAPECKNVADTLMRWNKDLAESLRADNTAVWHVIDVRDDGGLYPAGGPVNTGRTRVADVLMGKVQAEKGDMLYLLWFTANLFWLGGDPTDPNTVCCRVMDFMETARNLLNAALLPDFYPPHPIEQSMLLAIVSGRDEDNTPAAVYEAMLESIRGRRNRQKGSRKHDEETKLEVVRHYRQHPELTLAECAGLFGISPKTLSAWQKELLEEGKLD